ncbi:uncharacterized protein LOC115926400 [Strongylocentrotus purpuratus]|uniref:DUF7041 domain-containing protein n=1 Tax=Strongylocentrotus purpuratus TaxID=7668 RepID=A0A7M7T1G9_STRPU|nr:uncharacterized protein LOC115926400 [Strongylocentrotus purpuratus]
MPDSDPAAAATAPGSTGPAVTAFGLKLPPYWPGDPALWFAQVEAQFLTRAITRQETKFAHVISSLQPEVAQEVRDFIIAPPAKDRYDKLKSELVKRTGVSEQKRIHQLLNAEELGDRKPTQLLRRMRQLLGESTLEEGILKQLFLQRLPNNVRIILASSSDSVSIEQLAELADRILEISSPFSLSAVECTPASTTVSSSPPQVSAEVQQLSRQVTQLTAQVQALTSSLQEDRRSRSQHRDASHPPRRPSRSKSPRRQQHHQGAECWYHWTYGDRARKCVSPCSSSRRHSTSHSTPSTSQSYPQGNDLAKE